MGIANYNYTTPPKLKIHQFNAKGLKWTDDGRELSRNFAHMMRHLDSFKLEYMTRLFHSIRNKRFESYVIHRIWHQLDNDEVLFSVQQYHVLPNGKYALIDLYLPQINLAIEIDEPYHQNQRIADQVRHDAIVKATGCTFKRISIAENNAQMKQLAVLHNEISGIVDFINKVVSQMGSKFEPWDGYNKLQPSYYKKKGIFRVSDNDYVKNIDDIATIFNTKAKHRGYLRSAEFNILGKQDG